MTDTTNPITGTPKNNLPAQDLQINLEEASKPLEQEEIKHDSSPQNISDINLDLDLNLPETTTNDERLQNEDKKNKQEELNSISEKKTIEAPVVENLPTKEINTEIPSTIQNESAIQNQETAPIIEPEPIVEPIIKTEPIIEPNSNEPNHEIIEETLLPTTENIWWESIKTDNLQEDIKIISELETQATVGGLAPEVTTPIPTNTATPETPKTFNLDEMFTTPIPTSTPIQTTAETIATPINQVAFTLPNTTSNPTSNTQPMQPIIAPKKNGWIKTMVFILLFIALGCTTFFILKTMYPIEFANIFSKEALQTQPEIEDSTGTVENPIGTELTWSEELSGLTNDINTGIGTHESAEENNFGELNELETTNQPTAQTDVGRLADYVNEGNNFLAQGKTMGNNTVIKYGLYISKKATSLLENIANEEKIDNISWYFAQFDQYIIKLKELVSQPESPLPAEKQDPVSLTSSINDLPQIDTTQQPAPPIQ